MAERNFENRTLYRGDNLAMLRGINSETADLIATDPPFNKGRDFHATPDSLSAGASFQDRWSWMDDVQPDWIAAIEADWPGVAWAIESARMTYGEDMAAFLCFLGVRVIEMRRVLADTGSIYLHCDPTASHYIKALMDGVFGRKNFRNEIVWHYVFGTSPKADFRRKHDVIFRYSKTNDYHPVSVRVPRRMAGRYDQTDADGRKYHVNGAGKRFYEDEGRMPDDVWTYIQDPEFAQLNSMSKERVGYPTQKPLALYERIIRASSNPGDVVLDPFCGCATTPVAAEKLGRQWIGMDLWRKAHKVVTDRIQSEVRLDNPDARIDYTVRLYDEDKGEFPVRTDGGAPAAPVLWTPSKRQPEPWERLSTRQIKDYLFEAQADPADSTRAICAGCGEAQRARNLEVDHRMPQAGRGANYITNRVLLCAGCNRAKAHRLTVPGLRGELKKAGELVDAKAAERADEAAHAMAQRVRDGRA